MVIRLQCRRPEFYPWGRKIPWRRKCHLTPVFLPGASHGQRSLAGCSPQGCKELDMTERLSNKKTKTEYWEEEKKRKPIFVIPTLLSLALIQGAAESPKLLS